MSETPSNRTHESGSNLPRGDAPVSESFDLEGALQRVAKFVIPQGPIKDFVHHNPLYALERHRFFDALALASRVYGARAALPVEFYRACLREGFITEDGFERALFEAFPGDGEKGPARSRLLGGDVDPGPYPGGAHDGLRRRWREQLGGFPVHRRSHLQIFRIVGGYLDQGLAMWSMPNAHQLGLWDCARELALGSAIELPPFRGPLCRALLKQPAKEAVLAALHRTVGEPALFERYLFETVLTTPGWAGLVIACESHPASLSSPRSVSLLDFCAVVLVAELGVLERDLGPEFAPLGASAPPEGAAIPDEPPRRTEEERLLGVWHEALEWSHYRPVLGALRANSPPPEPKRTASAWAFFCIDDRFCSMRRHLEEAASDVETFGTPGFFGLRFFYRGARDAVAAKHCPASVEPRHLIEEKLDSELPAERGPPPWWRRALHFEPSANTFLRGWFLTHLLGVTAALRLAVSVFVPSLRPLVVPQLSTVSEDASFRLIRTTEERSPEGLLLGFSTEELADAVVSVFGTCGARPPYPPLIAVFGHGASSANNPFFSAYNCGVCAGRTGAPNARAFAKAANRADVRHAMRQRGVDLPESTWVIGAYVDTTKESVSWFDTGRIPGALQSRFRDFEASFRRALGGDAVERCRRFDTAALGLSPERALAVVGERAVSSFEPRPEYNHASNAFCVIGRRSLTKGVFLDRRSFLVSYDHEQDQGGQALGEILASVVPVCAGINLEYLFSRIDPWMYGAKSKLPHNVNGLLGVCNGVESDLLTGLPTQMTEIHDPIRLLVVVEHGPRATLDAVKSTPAIERLVKNEWIRLGCIDPATHTVYIYRDDDMHEELGLESPQHRWSSSIEAARAGRGPLPVGFIERAQANEANRARG